MSPSPSIAPWLVTTAPWPPIVTPSSAAMIRAPAALVTALPPPPRNTPSPDSAPEKIVPLLNSVLLPWSLKTPSSLAEDTSTPLAIVQVWSASNVIPRSVSTKTSTLWVLNVVTMMHSCRSARRPWACAKSRVGLRLADVEFRRAGRLPDRDKRRVPRSVEARSAFLDLLTQAWEGGRPRPPLRTHRRQRSTQRQMAGEDSALPSCGRREPRASSRAPTSVQRSSAAPLRAARHPFG